MPKGDARETRRGRPPREPRLLPPGLSYEIWRDMHMPMLEWLLGDLERTAALWEDCERCCRAAQAARDDGLHAIGGTR